MKSKPRKRKKIDLNKIDKLAEDPDKVKKIVWGWAKKSMEDQNLQWETAMKNAAEELGLNRAELVALVFGRDVFNSLAYGLSSYETQRRLKYERKKFLEKLFKRKAFELNGSCGECSYILQ
ncbi:MAG: hypothetical protein ACE5KE_12970 [Methanosarcinales archaeon]